MIHNTLIGWFLYIFKGDNKVYWKIMRKHVTFLPQSTIKY